MEKSIEKMNANDIRFLTMKIESVDNIIELYTIAQQYDSTNIIYIAGFFKFIEAILNEKSLLEVIELAKKSDDWKRIAVFKTILDKLQDLKTIEREEIKMNEIKINRISGNFNIRQEHKHPIIVEINIHPIEIDVSEKIIKSPISYEDLGDHIFKLITNFIKEMIKKE